MSGGRFEQRQASCAVACPLELNSHAAQNTGDHKISHSVIVDEKGLAGYHMLLIRLPIRSSARDRVDHFELRVAAVGRKRNHTARRNRTTRDLEPEDAAARFIWRVTTASVHGLSQVLHGPKAETAVRCQNKTRVEATVSAQGKY